MTDFPGFPRNRYTPVPDLLFDELLAELTNEELRVLLYVIRRTEGFKRDTDAIALDQFSGGITRHDGTPLDHGTGLSRAGVYRGIKGLVERGVLLKQPQRAPDGTRLPTRYAIPFDGATSHRRDLARLAGETHHLSPADPQETTPRDTGRRPRRETQTRASRNPQDYLGPITHR